MKPEIIEYGGWPHAVRLSNGQVELVATLDVGPRILRFGFVGGPNLFKEIDEHLGKVGGTEWLSYGGHRFWHAPESVPWTYFPDNRPVEQEWDGTTLTLTPPEEEQNRLQMAVDITLDRNEPLATINHRITNTGAQNVELAPWCISVMAAGGRAILPQEAFISHGESLTPARPLVLWHYTTMNDPRFVWGEKYIHVQEDASIDSKQKIGVLNTKGWAAYLYNGTLFLKHFPHTPSAPYPDFGSNCEIYTEPGLLEIESLGPLLHLEPGETTSHAETWRLFRTDINPVEADLDKHLLPLTRTPT